MVGTNDNEGPYDLHDLKGSPGSIVKNEIPSEQYYWKRGEYGVKTWSPEKADVQCVSEKLQESRPCNDTSVPRCVLREIDEVWNGLQEAEWAIRWLHDEKPESLAECRWRMERAWKDFIKATGLPRFADKTLRFIGRILIKMGMKP